MKQPRALNLLWIAVTLVAGASAVFLFWRPAGKPEDRVYRIGWSENPPFQERGEAGVPGGFVIELLREAARRRAIRLNWIEQSSDPESALRSQAVDLWPMVVITPERRKSIHISEPFLEMAACYVVRAHSRFKQPADLANATIAIADTPINHRLVRADFPNASLFARRDRSHLLDDVCLEQADAAFMDEHSAITMILRGSACANQPLNLISTPGKRPTDGIGSTFEARAAADALRDEIGVMATEGKVAGILSTGSYFSAWAPQTTERLLRSSLRERRWAIVTMAVSALLLLLAWLALRIRRERNRARRAERELAGAEEKSRAIVATAPDGIFIGDLTGRFLEVNDAACQQVGYTRQQLLERSVRDIVPARFRDRTTERLRGLTPTVATLEACYLHSDGSEIDIELKIREMAYGGQRAFVAVARDITERRKAERDKARLEDHLLQAQKLETIGRLAGGVAHDFNNLLTVINGYCGILQTELRGAEPSTEFLSEISKAAARATSLTGQLLAFSRKQVTRPRPLDLNDRIAASVGMLRRMAGEDIRISTAPAPSLGLVMADPGQMDQVLMNLVANARDAMPGGGAVVIATSNIDFAAESPGRPVGLPEGPYVLLTVTDTGPGIDEETRKHIFEPFFTTKGAGKNTGLGLATVYGIVQQCRGCVEVSGAPGTGTSFYIYLPVIQAPRPAAETVPRAGPPQAHARATVMVVEDQPDVRGLAVRILKVGGYDVLEASGGADALALSSRHNGPIHLLLTDVVMPGMDGRELADRIKPLRPGIRVLFTSGYTGNLIVEERPKPGEHFIPKPFSPNELLAKVRQTLE